MPYPLTGASHSSGVRVYDNVAAEETTGPLTWDPDALVFSQTVPVYVDDIDPYEAHTVTRTWNPDVFSNYVAAPVATPPLPYVLVRVTPVSTTGTLTITSTVSGVGYRNPLSDGVLDITSTVDGVGYREPISAGSLTITSTVSDADLLSIVADAISSGEITLPLNTGKTVRFVIDNTGATQTATILGVWNGTTVEPVTLKGWWDGSTVQPLI